MRLALYNFLVNKHPAIQSRYHKMHDNSKGMKKFLSHLYLLWLNFILIIPKILIAHKCNSNYLFTMLQNI